MRSRRALTQTARKRSGYKLTQADGPYIQVKGGVAWATDFVDAVGTTKAGKALTARTMENSVFEKRERRMALGVAQRGAGASVVMPMFWPSRGPASAASAGHRGGGGIADPLGFAAVVAVPEPGVVDGLGRA